MRLVRLDRLDLDLLIVDKPLFVQLAILRELQKKKKTTISIDNPGTKQQTTKREGEKERRREIKGQTSLVFERLV